MYLRCPNCLNTTRVDPANVERAVRCSVCADRISLERANDIGATPGERYRRARAFSRDQKIDLASAYSILLGIMPTEKALPVPEMDGYDPGFCDAVAQRGSTVQQAVERGDRNNKVGTLVTPAELPHGSNTGRIWRFVELCTAAIVLGVALFIMLRPKPFDASTAFAATTHVPRAAPSGDSHAANPRQQPPDAVVFKTDAEGRVTEVSGPDPKSVLVGLCRHPQFAKAIAPIALVPAVPPSTGDRLGIVRDVGGLSAERCVSIREDRRTGRWLAGDGRNPLEIQRAPTLPPGTEITPF